MDLSLIGDRCGNRTWNRYDGMDTSRTSSYVSLSLAEIQQRFEELQEDDLEGLTLEDSERGTPLIDEGFNPYSHS
jgi:hypothetical protein